ncbi:MAG: immunoglobulin-like domain-containing protein, partial [Culicoidibacterales bacterium]
MKKRTKKQLIIPIAAIASVGVMTPFIGKSEAQPTPVAETMQLIVEQPTTTELYLAIDQVDEIVQGLQLTVKLDSNAQPDLSALTSTPEQLLTTTYDETTKELTIVMTSATALAKNGDELVIGTIPFQAPEGQVGTVKFSEAQVQLVVENQAQEQINVAISNANMTLNTKPTIEDQRTASTFIDEGANFDPMSLVETGQIVAFDAEDGDDVTVVASPAKIDTTKVGEQTITYTVTDKANESTTLTIQVAVVRTPFTQAPVITGVATNVEIIEGEAFDPKANVKATDEKGDELPVTITGNFDNTTAGTYTLTFSATDRDGNSSEVVMTIVVKANAKPVFHGIEAVALPVGTAFDPLAGVSVTDEEDGPISLEQVSVTGSVNINVVGNYR